MERLLRHFVPRNDYNQEINRHCEPLFFNRGEAICS